MSFFVDGELRVGVTPTIPLEDFVTGIDKNKKTLWTAIKCVTDKTAARRARLLDRMPTFRGDKSSRVLESSFV